MALYVLAGLITITASERSLEDDAEPTLPYMWYGLTTTLLPISKAAIIMNAPERQDRFFPFDNSYARLPDRFYARLAPTPVRTPGLIKVNERLAEHLGLDPHELSTPEGVEILAGNRVPRGADPLAMAYAGHQFGSWNPQLGDGRALLLGEVIDQGGQRRDIQLKGSGPTPYSRMGDGRAALGPFYANISSVKPWPCSAYQLRGPLPL